MQMQPTVNRDLATIAHIATPILTIFTAGIAALLPMVLYLIKNSSSEPKDELLIQHLRESANAGLPFFVACIVHVALMFVLIGFVTGFMHAMIWIISCFKANGALKRGEPARYPLTIRLF